MIYELEFFDDGMKLFRYIWDKGEEVQREVFDNVKYTRVSEYDKESHFVILDNRNVVADVALQESPFDNKTMWFKHIAVHPRHEGKGLSRILIDAAVSWSMKQRQNLEVSSFSEDGEERIKHIFEEQQLIYPGRVKL